MRKIARLGVSAPLQSQIANRKSQISRAFTLIEMLTTVAVLIIVLGLMVSLARYVRNQSANELTKDVLFDLDDLMDQYQKRNGRLPKATPLIAEADALDETNLQRSARLNNRDFVQALRQQEDLSGGIFNDLPVSIYDEVSLRDAWGFPVVFMSQQHPEIGMSPKGYFFFSAGPDGQFLTRDDNLYSYEGRGGF